jgi:hypothetical protein
VKWICKETHRQDWAKLIRKLRRIGVEDEASRLQMVVSSLLLIKEGLTRHGHSAPISKTRRLDFNAVSAKSADAATLL